MAEDEKDAKDQEEEDAEGQVRGLGNTEEDTEGQKRALDDDDAEGQAFKRARSLDAEGDDTEGQRSVKRKA